MRAEGSAGQVGLHYLLHSVEVQVIGHFRALEEGSCVVDQDVYLAEGLNGAFDEVVNLVGPGYVGLDYQAPRPEAPHLATGLFELLEAAGTDDDVGAGLGEGFGEGHPQARGCSGHDGYAA